MRSSDSSGKNIWRQVRIRYTRNAIMIFLAAVMLQAAAYIGVTLFFLLKKYDSAQKLKETMNSLSSGDPRTGAWISVIGAVLMIIFGTYMYLKECGFKTEKTDLRKAISIRNIVMVLLTADGMCTVFTVIVTCIARLAPASMSSYSSMMSDLTDTSSVPMLIYVIAAGPAAEEMIFRGAMLKRLDHVYDFPAADMIQAALFGLYHMNLVQGIYSFILGLILGLIWKKTGTVTMTILTHILFNLFSFVLGMITSGLQDIGIGAGSFFELAVMLAIGIMITVPGLIMLKHTERQIIDERTD